MLPFKQNYSPGRTHWIAVDVINNQESWCAQQPRKSMCSFSTSKGRQKVAQPPRKPFPPLLSRSCLHLDWQFGLRRSCCCSSEFTNVATWSAFGQIFDSRHDNAWQVYNYLCWNFILKFGECVLLNTIFLKCKQLSLQKHIHYHSFGITWASSYILLLWL